MSPLIAGSLKVLLGFMMVGMGGVVATLGWRQIDESKEFRNILDSVTREIALNDRMIEVASDLANRWPDRSSGENFSYEPYHALHVTTLITSGRLDPRDADDREFLSALGKYRKAISSFNAKLGIVGRLNPGIFIRTDLISVTEINEWPSDGDIFCKTFGDLTKSHNRIKEIMED